VNPTDRDYTLGFIIEQPGLLEAIEIPADFFRTDHQREAWAIVQELHKNREPISLVTVAEKCRGNGVVSYLSEITPGLIPMTPAEFRRRVLKQRAEDTKKQTQSLAARDTADFDELAGLVEEARRLEREADEGEAAERSPLITFPELRNLTIQVEHDVQDIVIKDAVIFCSGPTGAGKSWGWLQIAESVSLGIPVFGKATQKRRVVYVDAENSLANLKERADILQMRSMNAQVWHSSMDPAPPKLDGAKWEMYKTMLPPDSLVVFDTRRALMDGKENDDDVAALVMGRCKALRDQSRTIVLLSHPTKANDRDLRGSGCWVDLADHTLQLFKVKARGDTEEESGAIRPGSLLCLATGRKTRFAPMPPIYLTLGPSGLVLADSPDESDIEALAIYIAGPGRGKNQTELLAWAKAEGVGPVRKESAKALLERGEKLGRWTTERGAHGSRLYYPAS